MKIPKIGSKESLGVKFKDRLRTELFKALVWKHIVFYWVKIVLKATFQKQSSKQSFPKVSLKSNYPEAHCETLGSYFQTDD